MFLFVLCLCTCARVCVCVCVSACLRVCVSFFACVLPNYVKDCCDFSVVWRAIRAARCDGHAVQDGCTALWHASAEGRVAAVRVLLAAGADARIRARKHVRIALVALVRVIVQHDLLTGAGSRHGPHNGYPRGL